MRSFKMIKKAALFFLILLCLMGLLSMGLNRIVNGDETVVQGRNKSEVRIQNEPENTIDMVMVGDSLSYCSFSPMQLWSSYGITSVLGSQSGQNIQSAFYMLKTAFRKQRPKLVILETNTVFNVQEGAGGVKNAMTAFARYLFPAFTYHDVWKSLVAGKQYPEENYKGFPFQEGINAYEGGDYMNKTEEKEEISSVVYIYLEKIRTLCEKKGAKLFLVSAPSPVNYNDKKHNALDAYARQKKLSYLDMNLLLDKLGIDWKQDTFDKGDHLNLLGAAKTTACLGKYLKENYDLPDHRSDGRYAGWNTLAQEYSEKAAQKTENMKKQITVSS